MGQLSKFPPSAIFPEPFPTNNTARVDAEPQASGLRHLGAKVGSQSSTDPMLATRDINFDLDARGPASFLPPQNQGLTNEQIDWLARTAQSAYNPGVPNFDAAAQAVLNRQVALYMASLQQSQNIIQRQRQPQAFLAPPGLETHAPPLPDQLPVPKRFVDVGNQLEMMRPDVGYGGVPLQSPIGSPGKVVVQLDQALGLSFPGVEPLGSMSPSMMRRPTNLLSELSSPSSSDYGRSDLEFWANTRDSPKAGPPGIFTSVASPKNSDTKRADTMKAQLQALQLEDPACVFIARGINKFGFDSVQILKMYFSRYGKVKGVYVSHSRVKSTRQGNSNESRPSDVYWRLRAAPTGFVVMNSADITARILDEGLEHEVNGHRVRLQPFQSHTCAKEEMKVAGTGDAPCSSSSASSDTPADTEAQP